MPGFFFQNYRLLKSKKTSQAAYWKKGQRDVLGFLFSYLKNLLLKKNKKNTIFGFFTKSFFFKVSIFKVKYLVGLILEGFYAFVLSMR